MPHLYFIILCIYQIDVVHLIGFMDEFQEI